MTDRVFNRAVETTDMKVLLGVGGTDLSFRALEQTIERVLEAGDDLVVAIIDDPDSDLSPDEIEPTVRGALQDAGLEKRTSVRHIEGDPGSGLITFAEREGFDRIVIGGGQTSPMGKIKVGSVAEFVVLNAHTTVTLVR